MKYIGSKARIAKPIATYINNIGFCEGIENYYEAFCGGCSVIEQVNIKNRYGNDLNKYLITLMKKVQDGMWEFQYQPREVWEDVKANLGTGKYEDWFTAWVGYGCSYKAKFLDGFAGIHENRNYQDEVYRALVNERDSLLGIHFINGPYNELKIEPGSIVYCDAPYIGTAEYAVGEFDFEAYYQWLKDTAKENLVFVSEYTMPAGFKDVDHWDLTVHSATGKRVRRTERLFVVDGGYLVDKYFGDTANHLL